MRVLLIYPPNPDYCVLNEEFSCCEPLGLEYIAAALLEDHDVDLMDMRMEPDLTERLSKNSYGAIGVAVPFTTSINTCNRILRQLKLLTPDTPRILGGHYPSTSLARLEIENANFVVVGEGVHTIPELIKAIEERKSAAHITGIAIIDNGKAHYTENRDHVHLDKCPMPARHLLKEYHDQYFHAHYKPITLMRFSVGCPFDCSFCILWKMTDRKYFTRGNDSILEELHHIKNENIYIVDDEAFIQKQRMNLLANDILQAGVKKNFHMYVRSDTVVKNPELFEKWAEAGLDSVLIGLESVFDDELQEYNKNISLEMAHECVNILHSNGIEIRANFIVKPDYTIKKFRQIRETIVELNIDRPTFAVLTPFIGTETYKQVKDTLLIDKPEFYDCYHTLQPTHLPLKTFYKEFADLFRTAQQRGTTAENNKIFYKGKGDSFNSFVDKIENSYTYY